MALEMSYQMEYQAAYAIEAKLEASDIYIYSGTPVAAGSYTAPGDYTGQLLVTFPAANVTWDHQVATNTVPGKLSINVTTDVIESASGTGTAAWFAIVDSTETYVMCGTVSVDAGGGDMFVLDTAAVTGNDFQILNLQFNVGNY